MADPPQIAVPAEISVETLRSIPNRLRSIQPNPNVVAIVAAAKPAPCKPVRKTIGRSMPKPRKTTQTCNSLAETFLPKCGNGFSFVSARMAPNPSATGAIQTEIISGQLAILPVDGFQLTRPLHRLRWRDRAQDPATSRFLRCWTNNTRGGRMWRLPKGQTLGECISFFALRAERLRVVDVMPIRRRTPGRKSTRPRS